MAAFDTLIELFRTFPGIGPRQAKRFAYHLVHNKRSFNIELARAIEAVQAEVHECTSCHRFFSDSKLKNTGLCPLCSDTGRDTHTLLIVAHDAELDAIERSKTYHGQYFVLGDLLPLTGNNTHKDTPAQNKLREPELKATITRLKETLEEIIIALSLTVEGELTTEHIRKILEPIITGSTIRITTLGRGISTGSELEYADSETLKNALSGRK